MSGMLSEQDVSDACVLFEDIFCMTPKEIVAAQIQGRNQPVASVVALYGRDDFAVRYAGRSSHEFEDAVTDDRSHEFEFLYRYRRPSLVTSRGLEAFIGVRREAAPR